MSFNLNITQEAAEVFSRFLNDDSQGIRLGVKPAGCSGFEYSEPALVSANDDTSSDLVIEQNNIKIFVDPISAQYLDNATVDFIKKGVNKLIHFDNPNVEDACGCGLSFSAKPAP